MLSTICIPLLHTCFTITVLGSTLFSILEIIEQWGYYDLHQCILNTCSSALKLYFERSYPGKTIIKWNSSLVV